MVAPNRTHPSPTFPSFPLGGVAVTKSDTASLDFPSVVYVGGAGNVAVVTANGDTVTFTAVPAGGVVPVVVIKVLETGTTATDMVAVY